MDIIWLILDDKRVVGKIVKLERFWLESFKLEKSFLSWKEPLAVGKLKMKFETTV